MGIATKALVNVTVSEWCLAQVLNEFKVLIVANLRACPQVSQAAGTSGKEIDITQAGPHVAGEQFWRISFPVQRCLATSTVDVEPV